MKYLLLIILSLSFVSAFAIGEYALVWLGIEPSSINSAIGGSAVGVVDIWHSNPLTFYTNPAISAFHEGISYGYTKVNWMKDSGIDDIYYHTGLMSFGYNGVSIILPAPSSGDKIGIDIDYGMQEMTNSEITPAGSFHSYDYAGIYGIAINPIELKRNYGTVSPGLQNFDFAIGLNAISITSVLAPSGQIPNVRGRASASCIDLGTIAKYKYNYEEQVKFEGVLGYTRFNLADQKIRYINANQAAPIYSKTNYGLALSMTIPSEAIFKGLGDSKLMFFDNVFSMRYMTSFISNKYDQDITGTGVEIGFLDTFYFRSGKYDDSAGGVAGNTSGYGINLHYKKLVSLSYNHARFPLGYLVDHQDSDDFSLNIDLMTFYHRYDQK